MALSVNTNVTSMNAYNQLSKTQDALKTSFARLASGMRINSSADDAAGLGVSKSMNAQIRSYAVAERNTNDGISMLQTADGGAEQIHGLLTRMRELAVQASNGSLSANDYSNIDAEFQQNLSEIDRVAGSVQFNGINLLQGTAADRTFQVGIGTAATDQIAVSFGGADTTELAVAGTSVTSFANAQSAITNLDAAIQTLSGVRAGFGASMNRFSATVSNLQSMQTNTAASLSRIQDTDVASETAALSKHQVLSQAGAAILSQANQTPQLALSLLRG
ncbi:MAG: flagellin FliC [Labilithrix sp.]|nr:flagellin FliC [Labilithrix sp.]MCW5835079.1 flagellin FliC [Labilithrix sp.]